MNDGCGCRGSLMHVDVMLEVAEEAVSHTQTHTHTHMEGNIMLRAPNDVEEGGWVVLGSAAQWG